MMVLILETTQPLESIDPIKKRNNFEIELWKKYFKYSKSVAKSAWIPVSGIVAEETPLRI